MLDAIDKQEVTGRARAVHIQGRDTPVAGVEAYMRGAAFLAEIKNRLGRCEFHHENLIVAGDEQWQGDKASHHVGKKPHKKRA